MLFLLTIAAAAALGVSRGGRLRNLSQLPITLPALAVGGLGLQLVAYYAPGAWAVALVVAGYTAVAVFLALNFMSARGLLRWGVGIAALGWLLNFAVIAANGGMPASETAARWAGLDHDAAPEDSFIPKHIRLTKDSSLPQLADVLPFRAGPISAVLSIGDLVLLVALGVIVYSGVRSPWEERQTRTGAPSRRADS